MKTLFVCTGNSCRSVMAEFLYNKMAEQMGLADWEAKSCGTAAQRSFPIPSGVKKALAQRGIPDVKHTPQLINREMMDWADVVCAMAKSHFEALNEIYPEHRDKIFLFLAKTGQGESDVSDPIGQSEEVYEKCCKIIEQGVQNLLHAKPAANPRS